MAPGDQHILAAWSILEKEIELAFQMAKPSEPERPIAAEQIRYVIASQAIFKFLKAVGHDEPAGKFFLLAEAFADVVDGLPHRLFSVEKKMKKLKGGRHTDTATVWRIRSSLCVGLKYLMAGGDLDQKSAINFALKDRRAQFSKLLRPGSRLESSITTWLKKFASDEVHNDVALGGYKKGMARLPAARINFSGDEVRKAGERLIADAADSASRIP